MEVCFKNISKAGIYVLLVFICGIFVIKYSLDKNGFVILKQQILNKYYAIETVHAIRNSSEIISNPLVSYETQNCEVQKNIAFAKTHKTGSSTLQNIILR